MIHQDFLSEITVPAPIAIASHLVLTSMQEDTTLRNAAAIECVNDASDLLRAHIRSELIAEKAMHELRKGIAESISETSLHIKDMLDDELRMEIARLQLLADLLASAKRAMGREGGPPMQYDEDEPSNDEPSNESDGGEGQAAPGV